MANYNQRQEPKHASTFLQESKQQAVNTVNALTKADLLKEAKTISDSILEKHKFISLELGEPTSSIKDDTSTVVRVVWPIKGSADFIGLKDSTHVWFDRTKGSSTPRGIWHNSSSKNTIDADINYNSTKSGEQERISKEIDEIGASYQRHFNLVNIEIENYNQELEQSIPDLVTKKLKALQATKAMEDALNAKKPRP